MSDTFDREEGEQYEDEARKKKDKEKDARIDQLLDDKLNLEARMWWLKISLQKSRCRWPD